MVLQAVSSLLSTISSASNSLTDIRPANADAELLMAAAAEMAAQEAAQREITEPRADSKYFASSGALSTTVVLLRFARCVTSSPGM